MRSVREPDRVHMFKTTRGLVLREVRYKEADRMLTVLTEDEGKISVKARGALRNGSKTGAATQLFAFSEFTILSRNGLRSVSEALTIEEFKGLRGSIASLALASYFAECAEAMSDEDQPNPNLLQLTLNCLYALSNELYEPERIKAAFELRLMCLAGYEPELSGCAVCGEAEPAEPWFLPRSGMISCAACRGTERDGVLPLCAGSLGAMRFICRCQPRKLLAFKIDADAQRRLYAACEAYLLAQTERRFQTLDYWKKVK